MRKAWIKGWFLGAMLLLAGCGTGRLEDSLLACPRLSLPGDIADLTRYSDPEAPDLSNLLFEARIVAIEGPCRLARGSRAVEAAVSVRFVVERGPAARGQPVTLPWLVAIVGPNGEVRDRQLFRLPVAFPANVTRTTVSSPAVTLMFPAGAERPIQEETILVGFALDERELAFNRRRGPR
jgi:hypothetical protein